jgi:hypothetical protein
VVQKVRPRIAGSTRPPTSGPVAVRDRTPVKGAETADGEGHPAVSAARNGGDDVAYIHVAIAWLGPGLSRFSPGHAARSPARERIAQ